MMASAATIGLGEMSPHAFYIHALDNEFHEHHGLPYEASSGCIRLEDIVMERHKANDLAFCVFTSFSMDFPSFATKFSYLFEDRVPTLVLHGNSSPYVRAGGTATTPDRCYTLHPARWSSLIESPTESVNLKSVNLQWLYQNNPTNWHIIVETNGSNKVK